MPGDLPKDLPAYGESDADENSGVYIDGDAGIVKAGGFPLCGRIEGQPVSGHDRTADPAGDQNSLP